jgi:hypothetical protein
MIDARHVEQRHGQADARAPPANGLGVDGVDLAAARVAVGDDVAVTDFPFSAASSMARAASPMPTTSEENVKWNGNRPAATRAISDPCGVGCQSRGPHVVEMHSATAGKPSSRL